MNFDLRRELAFDSVAPHERHPLISNKFWAIVERAGIKRYQRGLSIDFDDAIVIGLAPSYSVYDIELSEFLLAAARKGYASRVYLFDVLDIKDMQDMENFLPGFGPVFHTPVVGIWKSGVLVQKSEGTKARPVIEDALCIKQV